MALTAAERQKRYRERNGRNAGKRRINLVLAASVVTRLDELAQQYGVFKQEMLERVILEYGSLRRSNKLCEPLVPELEAEKLLSLADGDAEKALKRLTREAKQAWPDFSWSKTAAKQAPQDYQRLRAVRQCLRKKLQPAERASRASVQKKLPAEVVADQLLFNF